MTIKALEDKKEMLRGIIGWSPWSGDWKQCTRCGYQTKENVFSCPKCHDNQEPIFKVM